MFRELKYGDHENMPTWAIVLAVAGLIALLALAIWLSFTRPVSDWTSFQYP